MKMTGLIIALSLTGVLKAAEVDHAWKEEIERHRAERLERLRTEDGWLTLAGLFWLAPGDNSLGGAPDDTVRLAGAPPHAAVLRLEGETVTLRSSVGLTLNGEEVSEHVLRDDAQEGGPDEPTLGRLRFQIIRRGERFGVRVKDPEHPRRLAFPGLEYFALDPTYRVSAKLEPYEQPQEIALANVVGTTEYMLVPGPVVFTLAGRRFTLFPLVTKPDDTQLWFIFKDQTSGKESYGFRYLYAERTGNTVALDFNRAYNPPCAFSPYATCPLPPRENKMKTRIEAGERAYHNTQP